MRPHAGPTIPAYRVKALYLCVRDVGGPEAAAAFTLKSPAGRAEDDETGTLPLELWLLALRVFSDLLGPGAFERLPQYLVHPTNLGHWSLLLRGAEGPDDVYRRLVTFSGEQGAPGEWTEESAARHTWRASCPATDLDSPDRQLLTRALAADLAAVPLLFGRPEARVSALAGDADRILLEAVFPPRRAWLDVGLRALPLSAGAASLCLLSADGRAPGQIVLVSIGLLAAAAVVSFLLGRELAHRQSDRAQRTRIAALERETSVQEEQAQNARASGDRLIAGEYELGEQLGVGGAGAVWEARRVRDGSIVALKILRLGPASDSRASDRLQREAEALGLTWHPNIVRIVDHGILPSGLGYLVMERLRGETLSARSRRLRGLPPREVVRWGIQAAEALRAVHSAGIVHRDVKPGNLFIHREGNREVLKLLDFGAAYVDWAETRLTRDGAAVGTPGYASPEQEQGSEAHPSADIYSLGVSLLELWTGEPPERGATEASLRARLDDSLAQAKDTLSHGLGELLIGMTSSEAKDRPESVRDLRRSLQELLVRTDSEEPPVPSTAPPSVKLA
jgi:eukaryotic-like serine/threonine-protein kinase